MLWNSARNFLEKKSFEPRQTDGIAYVHIPFCESRCLFCMFYQNPYASEAADAYTNTLIKEFELGINELLRILHRLRRCISAEAHRPHLSLTTLKRS